MLRDQRVEIIDDDEDDGDAFHQYMSRGKSSAPPEVASYNGGTFKKAPPRDPPKKVYAKHKSAAPAAGARPSQSNEHSTADEVSDNQDEDSTSVKSALKANTKKPSDPTRSQASNNATSSRVRPQPPQKPTLVAPEDGLTDEEYVQKLMECDEQNARAEAKYDEAMARYLSALDDFEQAKQQPLKPAEKQLSLFAAPLAATRGQAVLPNVKRSGAQKKRPVDEEAATSRAKRLKPNSHSDENSDDFKPD